MNVLKSYSQGIKRATSEGKLVGLLWLINVFFASFIYFAFSDFLNEVLSRSALAENFLKTFDMNTFFELLVHRGKELNTVITFTILLLMSYMLASIFFDGGILFTLMNPRKTGEKRRLAPLFFQGGGKYFGRFLRLLIFSLILWLGVIALILILHVILDSITKDSTNEVLIFYMSLIWALIALLLIFLVKMIVEYARIKIVIEDSRKTFLSLFQALGFVFRKSGSTLAIYYLFVLTATAIFIIYWLAQKVVKTHSLLPIFIAFLIGQTFILSRGWVKVGLQAAQISFSQSAGSTQNRIESGSLPTEDKSAGQAT